MRHTCEVRPAFRPQSGEPTITIEFWRVGQFIEMRSYHEVERFLIGDRIVNWMTKGVID